jgi:uncharacterized caspase-like protein
MRAFRWTTLFTCIAAGLFFSDGSARAAASPPTRTALVIGNANYPDGNTDLPTPVEDARRLSETLQRVGFSVEFLKNVTKREFEAAIDRFATKTEPGSVALFFFAGHGIQVAGKNYLIPVDAHVWYEREVAQQGIALDFIQTTLAKRSPRAFVILLDSSRRSPFERRFRSVASGLAALEPAPGILSLTSSSPGVPLGDDAAEPNSPFVTELVKQVALTGQNAEQALKACRDAIIQKTGNQQRPVLTSGLTTPFWLDPNRKAAEIAEMPAGQPPAAQLPANKTSSDAVVSVSKSDATAPALSPTKTPPSEAVAPLSKPNELGTKATRPSEGGPGGSRLPRPYSEAELARKAILDARIARDPNDQISVSERGQLYAQHGEYALALAEFERSARLSPKDLESRNNLCWTWAILDELDKALKECNRALELRPNFVDALDSRALVYLKQGSLRKAVDDYTKALKINPKHSSALYGRGVARRRLGQGGLAEDDIANARALNPAVEQDYVAYGVN